MPRVKAVLALDVGDKRVGTALLLPNTTFVIPHRCFQRANGQAEREILNIIAERSVKTVVVGMPYGRDGSKNEQCLRTERFCERLSRRASIEIAYVDEHLTSEEARSRLQEAGAGPVGREAIDCQAACLILEGYLSNSRAGTLTG